MLLVAAHCRSGTTYTAHLLNALGLDVGHEVVRRDGCVSGYHITSLHEHSFTKIFHLVRHPLATIASSQTLGHTTRTHMREAIFIPKDGDVLPCVQAAYSWVNWNELIEKHAQWRFCLEDIPKIFPEFCAHVGVPVPVGIPEISKTLNTRAHTSLTWEQLQMQGPEIAVKVTELSTRYGYEL